MACHRGGRDKPNFKDYIRNMCGLILEPGKGGGGTSCTPPLKSLRLAEQSAKPIGRYR